MEREERIAKGSVEEEKTLWYQEKSKLLSLLGPLRLTIKEITPDGNWQVNVYTYTWNDV